MFKIHRSASLASSGVALALLAACGGGPATESESQSRGVAQSSDAAPIYDPATARALSIQSMKMEDPAQAEAALLRATELSPNLLDAWLLLAGVRVNRGDVDGAFASLEHVGDFGIRAPIDVFAPLQPLKSDARWGGLLAKLDEFRRPDGSSDVLFTLPEKDLLTEGIAYDPRSDAWYISAVRGRKIVRLGADGTTSDWLAGRDDVWGVFGMAIDSERRRLWAVTATLGQMRGFDPSAPKETALLEVDLDSAKTVARHELQALEPATEPSSQAAASGSSEGPKAHQLNDVTVAADGTVYVSDSLPPGGIYRLRPGGDELERVGEKMLTNSPQGLALVSGDSVLVIADYSLGLLALDLTNGESWFVEPPKDLWLQALDGLTAVGPGEAGDELVAIQNGGYPPHRILRLTLSDDHRRIESWRVAAQALPEWREPTLGTVVQDGTSRRFVYVAASQWPLFPETGEPDLAQLEPATIMSLELSP